MRFAHVHPPTLLTFALCTAYRTRNFQIRPPRLDTPPFFLSFAFLSASSFAFLSASSCSAFVAFACALRMRSSVSKERIGNLQHGVSPSSGLSSNSFSHSGHNLFFDPSDGILYSLP